MNTLKKVLGYGAVAGAAFAPILAFAQIDSTSGSGANFYSILNTISKIANFLIPLLITVAIIYFIWGVISYVIANDEEAKTQGRDKMIWGIIGLFAIVAVWGLVRVLTNTFLQGQNSPIPNIPCVNPGSVDINGNSNC